jgi:unsaturated rhamnogalacturonyl hydrolase
MRGSPARDAMMDGIHSIVDRSIRSSFVKRFFHGPKFVGLILPFVACASLMAQPTAFKDWPEGASPQEVGKRLADKFAASPIHANPFITYPEVCAWYGALQFASRTGDSALTAALTKRFQPLFDADRKLISDKHHVDFSVFGAVPLELYRQLKDPRYLDLGRSFADSQWSQPTSDGLSDETRFWIDDMFMVTILQVQAYRATGDRKYVDRAALEMTAYLKKLQQPNGLFFHADDVPFYWGRGNGWVAAGMTEILLSLPEDSPYRSEILAAYRKMMSALVAYQGKDGMWRQLIDRDDIWPESSSTGMFTFALATGATHGWLPDPAYAQAARRGWIALAGYIDQNGDVVNTCGGTNKRNDVSYYYERPRLTGDNHGQAAALWAARAFLP